MACRFSADCCGGEPCRAAVACWGGWGPHTPFARQIGPHPPQPTPPSRHGSLRCVWVRGQQMQRFFGSSLHRLPACSFSRVTPHSGAGVHGFARVRGEPSDNLCSQRAEDGSPLVRAQSTEPLPRQRSTGKATPPQPGQTRQTDRRPNGHVRRIVPAVIKMRMAGEPGQVLRHTCSIRTHRLAHR